MAPLCSEPEGARREVGGRHYFATSRISARRQFFVFEYGRVSTMRTTSPTLALLPSSWAWNFAEWRTTFLYLGWALIVSTLTTIVLSIAFETTTPRRSCVRARACSGFGSRTIGLRAAGRSRFGLRRWRRCGRGRRLRLASGSERPAPALRPRAGLPPQPRARPRPRPPPPRALARPRAPLRQAPPRRVPRRWAPLLRARAPARPQARRRRAPRRGAPARPQAPRRRAPLLRARAPARPQARRRRAPARPQAPRRRAPRQRARVPAARRRARVQAPRRAVPARRPPLPQAPRPRPRRPPRRPPPRPSCGSASASPPWAPSPRQPSAPRPCGRAWASPPRPAPGPRSRRSSSCGRALAHLHACFALVADGQDAGDLALGQPQPCGVLQRARGGLEAQVEQLLARLGEAALELVVGHLSKLPSSQRDHSPVSRTSS